MWPNRRAACASVRGAKLMEVIDYDLMHRVEWHSNGGKGDRLELDNRRQAPVNGAQPGRTGDILAPGRLDS